MYEKSFTHNVVVPFKYHKKGETVECSTITVNAPNNKVLPYTATLEQEHARATIKLAEMFGDKERTEQANVKLSVDEEANQIMLILGSGADLQKCYEAFRNILLSGNTEYPTCLVDGVEKMTQFIYEKMSPQDTKILLGKYLSNFLVSAQNN